ncbi:hypothetical protein KUTeg_001004 [Tegillarca granosa]|uniref:C2H2-type domain-containing protein n=1 Tax=Tegillarca granosa TaxID=220873 RepID=A0ABQ9FZ77_TEGGR|nr:hypothetical protein KUTeg_001004 [Tegillarca granosa]
MSNTKAGNEKIWKKSLMNFDAISVRRPKETKKIVYVTSKPNTPTYDRSRHEKNCKDQDHVRRVGNDAGGLRCHEETHQGSSKLSKNTPAKKTSKRKTSVTATPKPKKQRTLPKQFRCRRCMEVFDNRYDLWSHGMHQRSQVGSALQPVPWGKNPAHWEREDGTEDTNLRSSTQGPPLTPPPIPQQLQLIIAKIEDEPATEAINQQEANNETKSSLAGIKTALLDRFKDTHCDNSILKVKQHEHEAGCDYLNSSETESRGYINERTRHEGQTVAIRLSKQVKKLTKTVQENISLYNAKSGPRTRGSKGYRENLWQNQKQPVTSLGEVFNDEEEEEEEDGSSDFDNEEDTDVNHDNDNELELPLKPLVKDETVRIKLNGLLKPATVLEEVAPRSYKVRTEDGRYLRRNRKDLLKSNEGPIAHFEPNVLKADSSIADSDRSHDILTNSPEVLPSTNVRMPISIDNKPTIPVSNPIPPDKPHYVTKSGRQVKPKALHGIMRRPTSITPPPKRIKRKAPLDDVSLYIHRAR